jgi:hypothetical protein
MLCIFQSFLFRASHKHKYFGQHFFGSLPTLNFVFGTIGGEGEGARKR